MDNGIELAKEMGVNIDHLQKAWGCFQLKKVNSSPGVNIASTKVLLTPNELDYLIYLGLESITESIQKIIMEGDS